MNPIIAYCGIECHTCGAYLATINNDDELRKKTAAEWSQMFNVDIKPETVNCSGCTAKEGTHFSHCSVCEIRLCGLSKGVENCAHCAEYSCEKLEKFFAMAPDIKKNLEDIRAGL